MNLLGIFKQNKKRARPVGQSLEKGRDDRVRDRRINVAMKSGILASLIVLTLAAFPRTEVYQHAYQAGDVWRQETVASPFDFAILKDVDSVAVERREVRRQTTPFFMEVPGARQEMMALRDSISQHLSQVFEHYASYLSSKSRGQIEQAALDSLAYLQGRQQSVLKLAPAQWRLLSTSFAERVPGLPSISRAPARGPSLDETLLVEAWRIAEDMVDIGVLDVPIDSVYAETLVVRNESQFTQHTRSKSEVYGWDEANRSAQEQFQKQFPHAPEIAALGGALFRALLQPSLVYLKEETERERDLQAERVAVNRGLVRQNEVIIRKGDLITNEILRKLVSLEHARKDRTGNRLPWTIVLGQLILTLTTYFFFFLYLFLLRRSIFDNNRHVFVIALLFAGIIGLYAIAVRMPNVAMYAVPVAMVSLLLTVIFDSRVSLFGTLALAFIGSHLLRYDFAFTFATVFAGGLGIFSVRDIKNRGQFFISAGLVFIGYLLVLLPTWLLQTIGMERITWDLLLVGINAFLMLLAYPLLWVFEKSFDITTDLTLLELSDTNRPLMKELSLRAPGTLNHVLQVANLAEAAADAVGANALLTRVGALYHDVGKILKPEYFVENQRPGMNPHDQLKPRMSALIIASHVKEGVEIAKEYNLPQRVIDFIPMHHGTTRIEYFFRKAVEQTRPEDPSVLEGEFRYPGPRPNTKETGILMLADSVEAASRSLTNPTHKRLESLIDMIFEARRADGQLDETPLTFNDLTQIKATFLSILLGIYHVRIKYPDQIQEEEKERKLELARAQKTLTPTVIPNVEGGNGAEEADLEARRLLEVENPSNNTRYNQSADTAPSASPTGAPESSTGKEGEGEQGV